MFTLLVFMFAGFAYRIRPFNYHPCNLWEVISLLCGGYISFLAPISNAAEKTHMGWFSALMTRCRLYKSDAVGESTRL